MIAIKLLLKMNKTHNIMVKVYNKKFNKKIFNKK